MMTYPPEERYMKDCEFRQLVDLMELAIHRAQYTPSEIREAAILAATHFEMRNTAQHLITVPKGTIVIDTP